MQHIHKTKIETLRWAMILSASLAVLKFVVALLSSSRALMASALDSFTDFSMSLANMISVQKGSEPPDEEHAYGHEKIESLASYTQGLVILFFSILLLIETIRGGSGGHAIAYSGLALVVVLISAIVSLFLTLFLSHAHKHTDALILKVEATHYFSDLISYIVIAGSLLLVRWTGWHGWDMLGGICVVIYVGYLAIDILIHAGNELIDKSLPKSTLDDLDLIIRLHHLDIKSYHDMRTRKVGNKKFIDFHLVFTQGIDLKEANEISESLIQKIKTRYGNVDVIIHEDHKEHH